MTVHSTVYYTGILYTGIGTRFGVVRKVLLGLTPFETNGSHPQPSVMDTCDLDGRMGIYGPAACDAGCTNPVFSGLRF